MAVIFTARGTGQVDFDGMRRRCAVGIGGVVPGGDKREGDGASPAGLWLLRRALFRADRGAAPLTRLPVVALRTSDGWCDAPGDRDYNRQVILPHGSSAESLWRDDGIYDLIVVIGHNDAPVIAGAGSAIFLHLAQAGFAPTRGCIAVDRPTLEHLLSLASPGDALAIIAD